LEESEKSNLSSFSVAGIMCSNVQASNSSQEAEHCTFWQLTTKGEHQYNQLSEEEFHEAAGA
jgi:hypothetical protein